MVVKETKTKIKNVSYETKVLTPTPAIQARKTVERKPSAWDNIVIKKQISLELKAAKSSREEEGISDDATHESSETRRKNEMEKVLFEYFY